jgi:hypothetical protein
MISTGLNSRAAGMKVAPHAPRGAFGAYIVVPIRPLPTLSGPLSEAQCVPPPCPRSVARIVIVVESNRGSAKRNIGSVAGAPQTYPGRVADRRLRCMGLPESVFYRHTIESPPFATVQVTGGSIHILKLN